MAPPVVLLLVAFLTFLFLPAVGEPSGKALHYSVIKQVGGD
jgi:hypothetical protein